MQRERDAAILAASNLDDPNNINNLNSQLPPGVEIPNKKVSNLITTIQVPSFNFSFSFKCANCNREAMAECSLCRRTPYCSTFCQRKDWITHQNECARTADGTQQIMLIVDDQA